MREPLKKQMLETVEHLVDENRSRAVIQDECDDFESDIEDLKEQIDERKTLLRGKREELERCEKRCLNLIDELEMLSDGKPRLPNITPTLPTDGADPAAAHAVTELSRFGLSEKQIEKLTNSQLAQECSMKSIGDFINAISNDEWWHRKIKGWGESAVEKAVDAITRYREAYPIPDGDTRKKKCGKCSELYDQGKKKCPSCKSDLFELIDPNEVPGEQMTLGLPEGEDTDVPAADEGTQEMPADEVPEPIGVTEEELEPVEA